MIRRRKSHDCNFSRSIPDNCNAGVVHLYRSLVSLEEDTWRVVQMRLIT